MATLKNRIYNPTSFAAPRTAAAKKTAENFSVKNVNQKAGRTRKEMQTNNTKQMSAGMAAWVKANRSKLKNATAKQKAIFKQYDALKKEGRLPDTSSTKSRPSPQAQPSTSTKSAGTKPVQVKSKVQKAVAATKPKPEKPVVRGKFLDSNPPLKSQPKKPKRSSFPTGRTGARSYAAALAKYRKLLARIPKIKRKKPQRRGTAFR
tara:strand:- start:264 stop:878 length:615 start_codon:yes stop_codon:yes gene_type:complete